jgi:putative hydrolase of the HAD superfamily
MKSLLQNVRLIAFDLDDTLYPELTFVQSGFRAVAQEIEARFSFSNNFYNILWGIFSDGERTKTFDRALAKAGLTATVEAVKEMVAVYRTHLPAITLYPDAQEILECLRGRIKTGLITDGFLETQRNKVKALKIETYFNMMIYTDEAGRDSWKPSPWGYQKMMTHFDLQGLQCAYVGDNSLKDFAGAKALGWRTVKVVRSDGLYKNVPIVSENDADYSISTLTELKKLI